MKRRSWRVLGRNQSHMIDLITAGTIMEKAISVGDIRVVTGLWVSRGAGIPQRESNLAW